MTTDDGATRHTDTAALVAEIERLRIDLDRAESFAAECYEDIKRMHADMSADIHWRAKEIGRLRALLREVHDAAPYLGADINKRVRETLGDE